MRITGICNRWLSRVSRKLQHYEDLNIECDFLQLLRKISYGTLRCILNLPAIYEALYDKLII